jgi:hypothetical protein
MELSLILDGFKIISLRIELSVFLESLFALFLLLDML